jgi:hypothetical protein
VFALLVEASLIGLPTPHISVPEGTMCLGWAHVFVPML